MTTTPRAAIYARFSTERQDQRSIDDQVDECRRYALGRGWAVTAVYTDEAISGSTLDRPGLARLRRDLRAPGRPFEYVLVHDLSRLSRSASDTHPLVDEFRASGVNLISASNGVDTSDPHSWMAVGLSALMNQGHLEAVKAQTHRGLAARARQGFATGGRVYGFKTVEESAPTDPANPRKVPVINEEQAEIVREIFDLYDKGFGYRSIAASLNERQVASPYCGTRHDQVRRGWAAGTIQAMVRNEKYIGRFKWNGRKSTLSPNKKRVFLKRPAAEHIVHEDPRLAIVPADLWTRVQIRLGSAACRGGGRPANSGKVPHLLSGILRCGVCRGPMTITGRGTYGCGPHHAKGDAICGNSQTVSERIVDTRIVEALRGVVSAPGLLAEVVAGFNDRQAELKATRADGALVKRLDKQIREAEQRIGNLVDFIANGESSNVKARLVAEEAGLARLRHERVAAATRAAASDVPPATTESVQQYLLDLLGWLLEAPTQANDLLRQHVPQIVLWPEMLAGRRVYVAGGDLLLDPVALVKDDRVTEKGGCGARI